MKSGCQQADCSPSSDVLTPQYMLSWWFSKQRCATFQSQSNGTAPGFTPASPGPAEARSASICAKVDAARTACQLRCVPAAAHFARRHLPRSPALRMREAETRPTHTLGPRCRQVHEMAPNIIHWPALQSVALVALQLRIYSGDADGGAELAQR